MISLAIKYRPKTFDDVVEQGSVKRILEEQLRTNTQKNCYLFTGGAGTGKTTCARIFANEINRGKGNPIEIDAASNNGVDNIREIIEGAKFKSLEAPYKVYIIDECHMLSTGAWNAMLKLLEEPPAQTLFIMCTTDPQKIPATILSRVQRYDFQRITYSSIVNRLEHILIMENEEACAHGCDGAFTWETEALEYIAKVVDGGMRDAITLLDKCISYSPDVTIRSVVEAIGTVDYGTMFELTDALMNMDTKSVITIIENTHRKGCDLKQFMKQYSFCLLDICKYWLTGGFEYSQIPSTYEDSLIEYTKNNLPDFLYLLDTVIKMNNDIKWEQNAKSLIEATLILACQEDSH